MNPELISLMDPWDKLKNWEEGLTVTSIILSFVGWILFSRTKKAFEDLRLLKQEKVIRIMSYLQKMIWYFALSGGFGFALLFAYENKFFNTSKQFFTFGIAAYILRSLMGLATIIHFLYVRRKDLAGSVFSENFSRDDERQDLPRNISTYWTFFLVMAGMWQGRMLGYSAHAFYYLKQAM